MPLDLVLEGIMTSVGYWTGKPIVRLLSLGRLHVSFAAEPGPRSNRDNRRTSLTFTRDGKRYLDAEAVVLVGLLAWAAIIFLVAWFFHRR